jgi:hypothetical protein
MARPPKHVPRLASAAFALVAFLLYLALCPPVSGDKDSAEFTIVLALLGVAHPTGYPLFTLLGHFWVTALHALGAPWAWAANAWTALGGAVAIYFLQRLALALSPRPAFWLSILPAAFLLLNPIWTYETTLVEVYAWHVAWALGAATLFVHTFRDPALTLRHALAWGLVCGLGAAHHATSVFVILPLTIALLLRRPSMQFVLAGLAAGVVPLASYGLILWRSAHPAALQWPMLRAGWDGLIEHMTGRQYVGLLGRFNPSPPQQNFLLWFVLPFLLPGLVLLVLYARRAREGVALAAAALLGTVYACSYGVPDPSSYFLYPMAFGLAALAPALAGRKTLAWALGAVAGVLSIAWFGIGGIRAEGMVQFSRLVDSMWGSIPYEQGFVFWNDDMHYKLEERQVLYHQKPGLFVVNADVLRNAEPRRKFAAKHGFDPMPASTTAPDQHAGMEEYVNRQTPLPVIDFDPMTRKVRLLNKPQIRL